MMKPELDAELCKIAPKLYGDRNASMRVTCMCWGFDCGDGWFDLLKEASIKLEAEINKFEASLTPERYKELEEYGSLPKASQVKEKFGTLRLYMTCENEAIREIIQEAEGKSAVTCECCGKQGKRRSGGWIRTLCDKCHKEQESLKEK